MQKIVEYCNYLLNNSPIAGDALSYIDERIDKKSQSDFLFGYFPNSNNISLLLNNFGEEYLKDLNLIYNKEVYDTIGARTYFIPFFENHPLVMPYRDVYGNVIAIVGRSLLNDEDRSVLKIAKYKNTEFKKSNHLFGLYESKKTIIEENSVYVVEGQLDVIKAFEKGITNIVAVGSSNLSDYQFSLLCRYTDNIILLFDNDQAGKLGRERAISKYGKYADIKNFYLPKGYKDVDEYLKHNSELSFTFIDPYQ